MIKCKVLMFYIPNLWSGDWRFKRNVFGEQVQNLDNFIKQKLLLKGTNFHIASFENEQIWKDLMLEKNIKFAPVCTTNRPGCIFFKEFHEFYFVLNYLTFCSTSKTKNIYQHSSNSIFKLNITHFCFVIKFCLL